MILYVMVINQNKQNLMMFLKVLVLVNGKKHKDQNIMNIGIFMHVFQLISIKIANVVQKKNLIDRMFLFISVKKLKNYKIKINQLHPYSQLINKMFQLIIQKMIKEKNPLLNLCSQVMIKIFHQMKIEIIKVKENNLNL